jgi:hypothetical protein
MLVLVRLCFAAAVAVTLGFAWTVGQNGLKQTNRNLCELWANLPLPEYKGCEFQNVLVIFWMVAAAAGTIWIIVALYRLFFRSVPQVLVDAMASVKKMRGQRMWPIVFIWIGALIFLIGLTSAYSNYQNSQSEVLSALRRYVLPRHLSDEQKAAITGYVSKFPPVKNVKIQVQKEAGIDRPMSEPSIYANDIREALTAGGWELTPITWGDNPWEGLSWQFMQPTESQRGTYNAQNPRPDQTLANAFKGAKVSVGGSGGGSSQEIKEDTLTIFIGRRRMDDGDIVGKALMRERTLRQLKELEE